jgi:diguanylate cyclase (GGDEF)-like protein/PAS domain S-box-containing protein
MRRKSAEGRRIALLGSTAWAAFVLVELLVPRLHRAAFGQISVTIVIAFAVRGGFRVGMAMGAAGALIHGALHRMGELPIPLVHQGSVLLSGTSMLVVAGGVVGLLSDRVRAQLQRRRESEERYALAARGANDGLWDWDLRTDRVFYSERWREILGYRPEEVAETPEDWLDRIHPEDVEGVRADVQAHVRGETPRYENEHRIRRHDGSFTWVLTRGLMTRDSAGRPRRMAGWLTDISLRKDNEQRLLHHAFHDALTGLPNRALFMDRVGHAVARARRGPASPFAVLMLDLDRFKNVNDSLGHLAGDELLIQIAERIEACIQEGDTVARIGGDEFTILLEDLDDADEAERVAERLQRALAAPISIEGHEIVTSASIGVVVSRPHGVTLPLSLLRQADKAMYLAKKLGKGRHARFDATLENEGSTELTLQSALRSALSSRELSLYFQPIADLSSMRITGFETLLRWQHPELGMLAPREFIGVAEAAGLIGEIGQWVLDEACRTGVELAQGFGRDAPFTISVNLSAREVQRSDLHERVARSLSSCGLAPELLTLEVNESALMEDFSAGQAAFHALRALGVKVHMDDFGTGYSSLSYLHRFELDALKIDGSFVGLLHEGGGAEEIVRTVLSIAADLGLSVIAEGIEQRAQLDRLRALGCMQGQGFLLGAPMPLEHVHALLRRGRHLSTLAAQPSAD